MTNFTGTLAVAAVVGVASGADAAIWGMYKDAAHEGFAWPRFFRSIVIGTFAAVALQALLMFDLPAAKSVLLLFGLAYAAERIMVETWKTFFRNEDQSKYAIPMQFAIRGVPVKNRNLRYVAGLAYAAIILGGIAIAVTNTVANPTVVRAALMGFVPGFIIAIGGAWKDAPVEGFDPLKFFRSPILTMFFAVVLFLLSADVVLAAIAAIGYERAASENYKTFFFPTRPRGKFAGKPVTCPEMLLKRRRFVPAYFAIRAGLVWLVLHASYSVRRCSDASQPCANSQPRVAQGAGQ